MAFWDSLLNKFADRIAAGLLDRTQAQPILEARAYRMGFYRPQLKTKPGWFDDNVGLNFTGLIASRIVGQMIGRGVELDFEGEEETENERYVNAVLNANKQEILFQRAALSAAESGTGYLLIIRGGLADGTDRLQVVNPAYVSMDTLPEDYEVVIRYTIEYTYRGVDDKDHGRRKVIEHNAPEMLEDGTLTGGNTWSVIDYEQIGNRWEQVGPVGIWEYDFPPILHWQSLPSVTGAYGEPDISQPLIELQDRINFTASNNSKLIRLYAHPFRIGRGVTDGNMSVYDSSPDKMLLLSDPNANVEQLEPLGDLAAAGEHLKMLRQALFDISRTVDIDSMQDKLGAMTNFGLRVLYQDNLTMIETKRELFGDMLQELARRLQIINGMQPINCKPIWPDFLPVNEAERQTSIEGKVRMEVMSKQTAAGEFGLDWEKEQERLADERAQDDNVGAALLRAFTQGGGGFNAAEAANNNQENQNA